MLVAPFDMKKIAILQLFLLLSLGMFAQRPSDNGSSNIRNNYEKFEREDVSRFRDRIEFTLPEIPAVEEVEDPITRIEPVNRYFINGKKVVIDADPALDRLVSRHKEINRKKTHVSGWRIQIFSGRGRENVNAAIGKFLSNFQDDNIRHYRRWDAPIYRVRVGDFMRKEDAIIFLRKIREVFPDAFFVKDRVVVPKYKSSMENEYMPYSPYDKG